MESEKVKEIKKVLEEGQYNTIKHHQKKGKPILLSFGEILTLINELESENERLRHLNNSISLGADLHTQSYKQEIKELENKNDRLLEEGKTLIWLNQNMCKENQQLKDRIAELEKIGLNEEITVGEYLREMQRLKDRVAELESEVATLISNNADGGVSCHLCIDYYKKQALKQFAERLKEKICKIFDDKVLFLEDLDETLKECIK